MKNRNWIYVPPLLLLLVMAWYFQAIIGYILVAGILSLIGQPVIRFLLKLQYRTWKMPPAMAAFFTIAGLFAFFGGIISLFVPMVVQQARRLSQVQPEDVIVNIRIPLTQLQQTINRYQLTAQPLELETELKHTLTQVLDVSAIGNSLQFALGLTGSIFIAFFSITFITFFFLKDQGLFKQMIMVLVPDQYEARFAKVLSKSKELLTRYFIGVIVEMGIVMAIVSIGLAMLGIENALLIGFIAGLFNVIPYVGPIIGAGVGIIIGISTNGAGVPLAAIAVLCGKMAAVFGIAQLLDNIILQPIIYSHSVKAHPLEIFLVIMMAGNVAGIAGMILAVPTYSIGRVFVGEFFNQFKVVKALTGEG